MDRTIHIFFYFDLYMVRKIHIFSYVDVAGGRVGTATAAAASQQLSHLARPLHHSAQGLNIPFRESLASIVGM